MKKNNKLLMWMFFLLSVLFIGLFFMLIGYFINDYINLIYNNTLSGLEQLLFDLLYVVGSLTISVLGLISSLLSAKFATLKKIKIISYIESAIFIFGIVFSGILYF